MSDNVIVCSGTEHTNLDVVHGVKVTKTTHAVFSVDEVFVPTHVPTIANPMNEPLEVGQFVLWKRTATVQNEEGNTAHKEKRLVARNNYLKAARRQDTRYQKKVKDVTQSFQNGHTVGVKIHSADRTNTDVRLLTCKILESKMRGGDSVYRVYCPTGIVKNWFRGVELVDMSSVVLPHLNVVNPQTLKEVSLIQASRSSTGWQNRGAVARSVCTCTGACMTKRCPCKDAKLACGTKCHPHSKKCKNMS